MKHNHAVEFLILFCGLSLGLLWPNACAEPMPKLAEVSKKLPQEEQAAFQQKCLDIQASISQFKAAGEVFNAKSAENQSDAELAVLTRQRAECVARVNQYNAEMTARVNALESGDPMVVDARREVRDGSQLVAQVPELKNSPAADRIAKGFQAVILHDWPVALAWWQDALNRDPGNAALKRSVDLAQWMVDHRKAATPKRDSQLRAAFRAASSGDDAAAIRQFELVKTVNPAVAPMADHMIQALRKKSDDAKIAAEWSRQIDKYQRELVEALRDAGVNHLSVGNEKGAQDCFNDADWFSGGMRSEPTGQSTNQ